MSNDFATRSTKFLSPDHMNFEIVGKPALVIMHLQRGIAGEGDFSTNWNLKATTAIRESGMLKNCRELADAFRAKDLPVIFVQAVGNPIRKVPEYGYFYRQIEAANINRPYFTDEIIRKGLEVIPEMGYVEGKDHVLYAWMAHAFTASGLDFLLKKEKCETIVWGGFAQHSAVYSSSMVAGDLWYNGIIPADASCICVPTPITGHHEGIDDIVAEAIIGVLAPAVNQVTDTATVLKKLERYTSAATVR
jgi:nicotinamidase-related amidase